MELHRDDLLTLEYATAQELLLVEVRKGTLKADDIKSIFASIVAYTRELCIPNILVDFSHNQVEMNELEYQALMSRLAVGLLPTCIRKVARVATADEEREEMVNRTYAQIRQAVQLRLEFRNFESRPEALQWLQA